MEITQPNLTQVLSSSSSGGLLIVSGKRYTQAVKVAQTPDLKSGCQSIAAVFIE